MALAPIILFTYNRLMHTQQTIDALQKNILATDSELFIFSDNAKTESDKQKVKEVRQYLKTIKGFRKIFLIERNRNYGLANNIIDGVSQIIKDYGKVIVLEDDLLTSPYFLQYMNEALELYVNEKKVISIHGYIYPVKSEMPATFFLIDPGSLGWGTWIDRWEKYESNGEKLLKQLLERNLARDFNYDNTYPFLAMLRHQVAGKNSSWVIRWYAQAILNRQLTLYPGKSLVFHNGGDGSGTHAGSSEMLDVELTDEPIKVAPIKVEINNQAREAFKSYFKVINPSLVRKIIRKIKKTFFDGHHHTIPKKKN